MPSAVSARSLAEQLGTSFYRIITVATTLRIAPSIIRVPVGCGAKKPAVGFTSAEGRRIIEALAHLHDSGRLRTQ